MYQKIIATDHDIFIEYLIDILHIHENIELYVAPTFVLSVWFNFEGLMDHYWLLIYLLAISKTTVFTFCLYIIYPNKHEYVSEFIWWSSLSILIFY